MTASVLEEYRQISEEKTDESRFSPGFRVWIAKTIRKTQRRSWYYVNTTAKKVILIAVILSLLAVTAIAAINSIYKKKEPEIIVHEYDDYYDVVVDTGDATDVPDQIEVRYVPSYFPEGYWESENVLSPYMTYIEWENVEGRLMIYCQSTLSEDSTKENFRVDAEGVEKTVTSLGGQTVTLFTDPLFRLAVWTDGSYCYDLSVDSSISLETMEQIILSIEQKR